MSRTITQRELAAFFDRNIVQAKDAARIREGLDAGAAVEPGKLIATVLPGEFPAVTVDSIYLAGLLVEVAEEKAEEPPPVDAGAAGRAFYEASTAPPERLSFELTTFVNNDHSVEEIPLTRAEYAALKGRLAELRGEPGGTK